MSPFVTPIADFSGDSQSAAVTRHAFGHNADVTSTLDASSNCATKNARCSMKTASVVEGGGAAGSVRVDLEITTEGKGRGMTNGVDFWCGHVGDPDEFWPNAQRCEDVDRAPEIP